MTSVVGPPTEPLGQRARRLIRSGTAGLAMTAITLLPTWPILPAALPWWVLMAAAACAAPAILSISAGIAILAGFRHAHEAERRRHPDDGPPTDATRVGPLFVAQARHRCPRPSPLIAQSPWLPVAHARNLPVRWTKGPMASPGSQDDGGFSSGRVGLLAGRLAGPGACG
jgi:hypothetical protein